MENLLATTTCRITHATFSCRTPRELDESGLNRIDDVAVITISMDSRYEQNRWIRENEVRKHALLSDAPKKEFGRAYGLLVQETGYLARCVMVVDADGVIRYIEMQREMARNPDLEAAEQMARSLIDRP